MLLAPALLAATSLAAAGGRQETPRGVIPRVDDATERPEIDGRLDEPFWDACLSITDLRQVEPIPGAPPSERSEILLAYDDQNIYVGIRCFDSDPSAIRATQMARDANLDPDDRIELLFDSFGDNRNGFWFQLGAGGSKGDALISREGSDFNKRWDTIWYGQARITDEGWAGEIRIPAASISFDPKNDVWGFNVRRHIRRRSEEVRWSSCEPRLRFFRPANAGELEGIEGMDQGLGLDLVPFFVAAYTNHEGEPEHLLGDAGLDLFYRLSPNTKLSFSYNTDFAETEVDARAVNLSRFQLFFPEKRKFFLEDSGVFTFGAGGRGTPDVIPFFSRRIGLDADGNEVPLVANVKLTSTSEGYSFGLLDSQTEATGSAPERNLFVGRFSKNILEQSSVGVIFTRGDPTGAADDYTVGADLNLRTTEFLGDRSLTFTSYVVGTQDSETSGNDAAYAAKLRYPNDEIQAEVEYSVIEENFDPALGFVRRTGIRRYEAELSYNPRINSTIRRLRFEVEPELITDMDGTTETREFSVRPLGIEWESGEDLSTFVRFTEERLTEDFDIQDPVTIPVGVYNFVRHGFRFETSNKRDLSAEVGVTTGTFYDGRRSDYSIELDWRASAHALFGFEYELNEVHLEDGDFDVNLARLRADFNLNPRTSWSNFVQWDDVSEDLGLNSRLRIIFEPGRDLFLVLNQGWSTLDDQFASTSTDLRFKVGYTFRF